MISLVINKTFSINSFHITPNDIQLVPFFPMNQNEEWNGSSMSTQPINYSEKIDVVCDKQIIIAVKIWKSRRFESSD